MDPSAQAAAEVAAKAAVHPVGLHARRLRRRRARTTQVGTSVTAIHDNTAVSLIKFVIPNTPASSQVGGGQRASIPPSRLFSHAF